MTLRRLAVAIVLALPVVPTLVPTSNAEAEARYSAHEQAARDLEDFRGGTASAAFDVGRPSPTRAATRAEAGTRDDVARYAARDSASRDLEDFAGGIDVLGVVLVVVIVIAVLALINILVPW